MKLKEEINKSFSNQKEKEALRASSAKIVFLFILFIFFLVLYFIWAWIKIDFLWKILSPLYLLLLISLNIFIFFVWKKFFPNNKIYAYIFTWIFTLIIIFFALPIII